MASLCVSCIGGYLQSPRVRRQRRRLPDRFVRLMVEQAVSRVFVVASTELWSETRGPRGVVFARQVAIYLAHVSCGLNLTETGHLFGRDRTTVAHACKVVEALRDDRHFDRSLELLEGVIRSLSRPYRPLEPTS